MRRRRLSRRPSGFGNRVPIRPRCSLLEEAVLLLGDGQTAEVKELAQELAGVLESKGVHREALAALRLFQEAAERETATTELTRRVLGFLYRARYDPGLCFA
jgi:hypothetical protein